ncbi:MAG: hypothetical protein KIT09_15715 [Bryobacteraceae bacterium]|nr:hypothetical protein [Bryobacteraceae bacterium]
MQKSALFLTIFVAAGALALRAADADLGTVTSSGDFLLDDASVSGNATVQDGSRIQTRSAPSIVRLNSGARVELGQAAKATIHRDHLVLEAGTSDVTAAKKYEVLAASLRVSPGSPDTTARVVRRGEKTVQVGVAKGAVRVFNSEGILLANVFPGTPLEFEPQVAGAAPPSSFAGCLLRKSDRWIIYDQTTKIIAELRGSGFERDWGHRVQVIGTTDPSAQSDVGAQVVDVTSVTRFGEGGCQPVATSLNAELPAVMAPSGRPLPPPSNGGGMSAGTKVAIAAGIGGGAAAGILAGTRGSSRSN